jgi:hypothetical protein
MARKLYFDVPELAARGWHERRIHWYLGRPAKLHPQRGPLYRIANVEIAESDWEWPEQQRLEFEEDQIRSERGKAAEGRRDRLRARRTALYRFYDLTDVLLYVGITANVPQRFEDHRKEKPWWPDVASKRIEWLPSREEAEAAERFAIVSGTT